MKVRIYRPRKTAMQSGRGKSHQWVLEYPPNVPRAREPLMGWTSSRDMLSQVRLHFATQKDAVAYAKRKKLSYELSAPHAHRHLPKSYDDNFGPHRKTLWTH